MSDDSSGIAICIPTLNEAASIGSVLERTAAALTPFEYDICIVDDGSRDGTREIVKKAAVTDRRIHLLEGERSGVGCMRGQASRRGLEWLLHNTQHSVFVDLDADGSQRPEELPAGIAALQRSVADVAIASKYVAGAEVAGRPLIRRLASRSYNTFLRAAMRAGILDYSNSYRFYSRRAAELLLHFPIRYNGPVHLLEMMAIWLSNGMRVVEFPTLYDQRGEGASKVIFRDFLTGAAGAVDVALRYNAGYYRYSRSD